MTKWSEPSVDFRKILGSWRRVGVFELTAFESGEWDVSCDGPILSKGTATDLASAQAAADAAVEELLAEADADFGLRFGPSGAQWERAMPEDRAGIYTIGRSAHNDGRWVWAYDPLNGVHADEVDAAYCEGRAAAIQAAREHDAVRSQDRESRAAISNHQPNRSVSVAWCECGEDLYLTEKDGVLASAGGVVHVGGGFHHSVKRAHDAARRGGK